MFTSFILLIVVDAKMRARERLAANERSAPSAQAISIQPSAVSFCQRMRMTSLGPQALGCSGGLKIVAVRNETEIW
jgi:hypothetical protein